AGAGPDADVDAAGDDRLHRLAAAVGIENLEIEPVLLEDAGALADVGNAAVPVVGRTDRELERVVGARRAREDDGQGQSRDDPRQVMMHRDPLRRPVRDAPQTVSYPFVYESRVRRQVIHAAAAHHNVCDPGLDATSAGPTGYSHDDDRS